MPLSGKTRFSAISASRSAGNGCLVCHPLPQVTACVLCAFPNKDPSQKRLRMTWSNLRTCAQPPAKGSDGKRLKQKWALEDSNLRTCAQPPAKGSDGKRLKQKWALEDSNLRTCAQPPAKGSDGKRLKQKWALEDSNLRTCAQPPARARMGSV
jgi:hypothetical protein